MQSLHDQRTCEGFGLATFPAVYARAVLARVLAERGVFDEGDTHGQEAIRIAEASDSTSHRRSAANNPRGAGDGVRRLFQRRADAGP